MHVIAKKTLMAFWTRHPDAEQPLRDWFHIIEQETFTNFASLRTVFPSADYVDGLTVFNIGGNKYRLIASIPYHLGRVYIRQILTHAEYNRNQWKRNT